MFNLMDLLKQGQNFLNKKREEESLQKLGNLRGGNAGALIGGKIYGSCPRIHHLRSVGIEIKVDSNTQVMFHSGLANENSINEILQQSIPPGLKLLREDECPVTWNLDSGRVVSGRPDFVYVNDSNVPVLGLELKDINSIWTARNIIADEHPSSSNLIQAAFYSWRLGEQNGIAPIPYKLVYTSSPYWHLNNNPFLTKLFLNNPAVEHQGDRPFRIKPGRFVFDLTWKDGTLYYSKESSKKKVKTLLTIDSIREYYLAVDEMDSTKTLGPRPTNTDLLGEKSYSPCDYCQLADLCKSEDRFTEWKDKAVLSIQQLNKENTDE